MSAAAVTIDGAVELVTIAQAAEIPRRRSILPLGLTYRASRGLPVD